MKPTVGGELVPFEDGDAEDVLVQIFDVELTREVPLRIQGVVQRSGCEGLGSHGHFTVRVTFTCVKEGRQTHEGGGRRM